MCDTLKQLFRYDLLGHTKSLTSVEYTDQREVIASPRSGPDSLMICILSIRISSSFTAFHVQGHEVGISDYVGELPRQ